MTKEDYYQLIKGIRAKLSSDECRECSCPKTNCEWHGDCYTCVRQHRIHGDHVPNCLQVILDKKIAAIASVAEMTVQKKAKTPAEYWDYVRQCDAEESARPTSVGDLPARAAREK